MSHNGHRLHHIPSLHCLSFFVLFCSFPAGVLCTSQINYLCSDPSLQVCSLGNPHKYNAYLQAGLKPCTSLYSHRARVRFPFLELASRCPGPVGMTPWPP